MERTEVKLGGVNLARKGDVWVERTKRVWCLEYNTIKAWSKKARSRIYSQWANGGRRETATE